jgi:hypothetical protein
MSNCFYFSNIGINSEKFGLQASKFPELEYLSKVISSKITHPVDLSLKIESTLLEHVLNIISTRF